MSVIHPDGKLEVSIQDTFMRLTAGAAVTVGTVHCINNVTLTNGEYGQTRVETAASLDYQCGWACVAQQTAASGATNVKFQTRGICKANVDLVGEALAVGQILVLDQAGAQNTFVTQTRGTAAQTAGTLQKVFARSREAVSSTTAVVTVEVELNGIEGFGTVLSIA